MTSAILSSRKRHSGSLLPALPGVGRLPYLWAAYALLALVPYALGRGSAREAACTVVAVVAVLTLYLRSFRSPPRAVVVHALLICAIGMAVASFNAWAYVLFPYAACCGACLPRLRDGFLVFGATLVLIGTTAVALQYSPAFWEPALFFTAVSAVPALYLSEMIRARTRLLRKQEEVELLATLAERGRIARDMHDVLGHGLSVIVLKSQLLGKLMGGDLNQARVELADIEQTARESLKQLRECVDGYRGAGLPHELLSAERSLAAAGVTLSVDGDIPSPPTAVENLLVLSLREAVTNVLRHSGATQCRIRLRADAHGFVCEVDDDGVGLPARAQDGGNGLRGLRERMEAAGGHLRLQDLRPGTSVGLHLPASTS